MATSLVSPVQARGAVRAIACVQAPHPDPAEGSWFLHDSGAEVSLEHVLGCGLQGGFLGDPGEWKSRGSFGGDGVTAATLLSGWFFSPRLLT